MKSIFLRNFIYTALVILLALLIMALAVIGIGRNYVAAKYKLSMENSADVVARAASAFGEDYLTSWNLSMLLSTTAKATGNTMMITNSDDVVVCCSDESPLCEHMGQTITKDSLCIDPNLLVISVPIDDFGNVLVYINESSIFSTWYTFIYILLIIFAGVFIIIIIFEFWFSKYMSKPLDEMSEASRMYARGDFSKRIKQSFETSNEMGTLISSFNNMADSLEKSEQRRSEFISNISHELRTPMTTIAGFADGILDGTIPKEDEDKYLKSISDETKRLSRLVRNMLDVSKMKSMSSDVSRRSDFDLTELVLETLLSFESRATKKNLDVDPQFPDKHIIVHADKDGITQVIYNLLDNAVKFAKENSTIVLRLYIEDDKACVSVLDEGETIPADDLPYIFDRFHKSDRSRSLDKDGVGLGLYLVKTIINGHDEDIAVKSENGFTEFAFTLPVAENK